MSIENIDVERLEKFLKDHDLHLLTDSTNIVSVGTIYRKYEPSVSRRIGYVDNFVLPEIKLPEPKQGSMHNIRENLRNKKSLNFMINAVSKFISSFGFSVNTSKEEVLEVSYSDVTLDEIDIITFSNLFKQHHLDTTNSEYDSTSEYYLVTRIVKSNNFIVNMKASKDLKAALSANHGDPIIEGQYKLDYAKGKLDEVTLSYKGQQQQQPLVFGVHLRNMEFDKDTGNIGKLIPLTTVIKLLGKNEDNRVWD